ncbi:glutathione transferase GstA [Gemmobacter serpentinus]|uniref:glutathione transferase GstA n=1 Tax=Gemmobacter serpentinus TaxID=2652247 RepID=UPI00124BF602|nr:glutathione transferase GstA [Gemmobacter serpentinus]
MKLYYTPGACSLASHIALRETGAPFELVKVDLRAKTMAEGANFLTVSPRGAVPVLELDDGAVLTECVAIMQYVTDSLTPGVLPATGTLARARLQEMLNFIATEVHKVAAPMFHPMKDEAKAAQLALLDKRLQVIEDRLSDGRAFLGGADYSIADGYFFTITNWSRLIGHDLSRYPNILALRERVGQRPAVQAALKAEGLI